jgi:hypothetical protein
MVRKTSVGARKTSVRLRYTSVRVQYAYYQNTHSADIIYIAAEAWNQVKTVILVVKYHQVKAYGWRKWGHSSTHSSFSTRGR